MAVVKRCRSCWVRHKGECAPRLEPVAPIPSSESSLTPTAFASMLREAYAPMILDLMGERHDNNRRALMALTSANRNFIRTA